MGDDDRQRLQAGMMSQEERVYIVNENLQTSQLAQLSRAQLFQEAVVEPLGSSKLALALRADAGNPPASLVSGAQSQVLQPGEHMRWDKFKVAMFHLERSNIESWRLIRGLRLLNLGPTSSESLDLVEIAITSKNRNH